MKNKHKYMEDVDYNQVISSQMQDWLNEENDNLFAKKDILINYS